ncbi:hypothetical protein QN366_05045 [Pseudomonas sp. CCC3.2]|uniref:hypothetical protein n=1 Tax=unclassified Pseudomonas TaxID=196821 RepID=UPI002AB57F20|nr:MULTISPECIES: hypothetical protein [unclassified Pseudomonas]MDY7559919.1 hypothetical protein [Pseudomonas sp. AB6]MEB0179441.1 hypothetical protein [Pseudomonas sp. CCC3.2]MEB0210507.1 hypothetical protein [Pseudomonas sp. AB6]
MQKLQVMTDDGWTYVACMIGKRIETTSEPKHGLPRNCPELAHGILSEFEKDFPDREFRLTLEPSISADPV